MSDACLPRVSICSQYWTEVDCCGMKTCPSPSGDPEAAVSMVDMWFQDQFGAISRPANTLNNSQQCSQVRMIYKISTQISTHLQPHISSIQPNATHTPQLYLA